MSGVFEAETIGFRRPSGVGAVPCSERVPDRGRAKGPARWRTIKRVLPAVCLTLLVGCGKSEPMIHEQLAVLDEFSASTWGGCRFSFHKGSFEKGSRKGRSYWQCKGQTSPGHPYTITLVEREPESGRAGELVLEYRLDGASGVLGLAEPLFRI